MALSVRVFLASKQRTLLEEHPPYSPNLAPNDGFLFLKIKGNIERKMTLMTSGVIQWQL
jgi:hypothetical protein